jgi:RimJ/RimL family protein N-acetyltransferase
MLKPDLPIRTERLLLRAYTLDDLDFLSDVQSRPEVVRYLLFDVRDRTEIRHSLDQKIKASILTDEGDNLNLVVTLPDTGEVVGEVILFWTNRVQRQGEVGYVLHPGHVGHGYATEAAVEMLRLGFEGLGLHRIVARLDNRNTASARVLERLGMRREAHFVQNEFIKGEWADEVIYAMLAAEWRARA